MRFKFRGKRIDNGKMVFGHYWTDDLGNHFIRVIEMSICYGFMPFDYEIDEETVGQFIGLKEKECVGDIVKYENNSGNFCIGVIKYGEYEQDGSAGEYPPSKCLGFYIERIKTLPFDEWDEEYGCYEPDYGKTISILKVDYEIIGNIHDNKELLEVKE
jgi:hypothetical protein